MLRQFLLDCKLHGKNYLLRLLFVPVGFLAGIGILALLALLDEVDEGFALGTLFALFILIMVAVIYSFCYHQEFMIALSMGRTRRDFLLSYTLRQLLWLTAGYLLVLAMYAAEMAVQRLVFVRMEVELSFLTDWRLILALIPGLTLVGMFVGSIYSRFGKPALVPLYFAWLFICFVGPQFIDMEDGDNSVLARTARGIAGFARAVPMEAWIVLGIAALCAMLVSVLQIARKQLVH